MFLLNAKSIQGIRSRCKFTIQNVPIKLNEPSLLGRLTHQFTIQNVPIKLCLLAYHHKLFLDLQYKMFLLNNYYLSRLKNLKTFTIQNVPIKLKIIKLKSRDIRKFTIQNVPIK